MANLPNSRQSNIVVQEFKDEILIYDLTANKAFCLNKTSAFVWQMCDGKHSIEMIARALSHQMEQPISEDFVWLALDQLKRDNLLENNDEVVIKFNGLSRREVIRKIGLASLVTLPFISSIVAPSPAHAQSGTNLPLLAACSNPSQCSSGNCFANSKCCIPGSVNGTPPGQGNSPVAFPGNCATLTQSQLNAQCAFNPNNCCAGNPWVATGCSPFGGGLVQTTCNCS